MVLWDGHLGLWNGRNLLIADIALPSISEMLGIALVKKAYRLKIPTIVVSGKSTNTDVRDFFKYHQIIDFFEKGKFHRRIKLFSKVIQDILPITNEEREERFNAINQMPYPAYHDFQVLVTDDNKIRVCSDQGDIWDEFRLEMNEIDLTLQLIEEKKTNSKLLKRLGDKFYQVLFPTNIRSQLRATMADAETSQCGVRLRLVFKSPELAKLPWEFLYDKGTNSFLANNPQTVLSRYIDVPLQQRELKATSLPLKILLVISSPTDLAKLDADGEEHLIKDALFRHIKAGQIELDVLHEATIRNINQKLREKPYNVFHFIGHGSFENDKGSIALVDQDGTAKMLDDEGFASFFLGNRSLGLAVLNSCEGAAVSSNEIFAGIAPNLVQRGIPAVVAMQYPILDNTAKLFTDEFYRTLALGWPVDAAIQTTRNAISIEVGLDQPDFATPVLYMRGDILPHFSKL
ncbi:MAG: CHAT domain-containing protein [Nostocaceae cyanobacterium]|nr:CHAT domain-containing protein [Nostocaceae cyanobacterium]